MQGCKRSNEELLKAFRSILTEHPDISQNTYDRLPPTIEKPGRKNLIGRFGSWEHAKQLALEGVERKAEESASKEECGETQESEEFVEDYRGDTGTLTSKSRRITSLDEALDYFKVDLNVYEVERYVVNKWEMGSKNAEDNVNVTPLYQVKVWLKKKVRDSVQIAIDAALEEIKSYTPQYPSFAAPRLSKERYLYEISIFDLHLAKLCWEGETGANYDSKIAESRYLEAIDNLLSRVRDYPIERVLLPTGSDLLHVDNTANTTFAGTRQDVDTRIHKAYRTLWRMLVTAIDRCAAVAPVDVLMVPGNHDFERVRTVGEVLYAWYRNTDRVTIDNAPTTRKYYRYGKSLLGFTHGDKEKMHDLPLIMARERQEDWAQADHFEYHLGHWHKKGEQRYTAGDTFNGVVVRIIPSLCEADSWHAEHGYTKGLRSAEAYLWEHDTGYAGHFSSNVL